MASSKLEVTSSKLASNVYMGSGSPGTLTGSRAGMLVSSESSTAALTTASTTAGAGTGLGVAAKGAGLGTGLCKIATVSGLTTTGTIVGAVITGGIGFLVGYLTYRGVKAFVS